MKRRDDGGLATTFLWLEGYGRVRSRDWVVRIGLGVVTGILALGANTPTEL